jgi:hypothetical protein
MRESVGIGTLRERPLHAALKTWYAGPEARFEVSVDGFVIDIVQDDLLVEIQTRNFAAIRRKLASLTARHRVRLVYPVAQEKWIVKLGGDGQRRLGRRKSPKRGAFVHIFEELVSFPSLVQSRNFSVEVLLIQEEESRRRGGSRGWRRRGWTTQERRLLGVVGRRLFETPDDLGELLPDTLPDPFTTSDLERAIARPRRLAQKMAYCLREMGVITPRGKRGNAVLYKRFTE